MTTRATNEEIGQRIGLGHSGVSRIRSGDRFPSLAAMRRIERAYGWKIGDQIAAREKGQFEYAHEFDRRVNAAAAKEAKRERTAKSKAS